MGIDKRSKIVYNIHAYKTLYCTRAVVGPNVSHTRDSLLVAVVEPLRYTELPQPPTQARGFLLYRRQSEHRQITM